MVRTMRLIDADALLNAVKDFPYGYRGMIKSVIENQPTIEERPEDVWLGKYSPYRCDHCGHYSDTAEPYCCKCGSKMEVEYE